MLVCLFCASLASSVACADPPVRDADAEAELVKLHEEVRSLKERITALVEENARLKRYLSQPSREVDDFGPPPSTVDGVITAVKKEFAEISIGADDGLKVGHKLKVVRDGVDSGLVVVRRIDPDRAVVESVEKDGVLKTGDGVVTLPLGSMRDE
jgi:hypothetical protein